MQSCYIDSASIWEVVTAFDLPSSEQYDWPIQRLDLITFLVTVHSF